MKTHQRWLLKGHDANRIKYESKFIMYWPPPGSLAVAMIRDPKVIGQIFRNSVVALIS